MSGPNDGCRFNSVASERVHEHSQVATLPGPKALGDKDAG